MEGWKPFSLDVARIASHRSREVEVTVLGDELNQSATKTARPARTLWQPQRITREWKVLSAGAAISFLVHALLIGSLALGSGHRPVRSPLKEGFRAVERNADGTELVSVLFFVKDQAVTSPDKQNDSAYHTDQQKNAEELKSSSMIAAAEAGRTPLDEDAAVDAKEHPQDTFGDAAATAMLFGRYMGQIKARIERAWERPTTAARSNFNCTAQVRQSKHGEVQEITLQRCDVDGQWQASLFRAIQNASPLSAPPSENVFTDIVTLSFSAQAPVVAASQRHEAADQSIH
jgi:hypothetical protein